MENLGKVYTPDKIVKKMISLSSKSRNCAVLEPSAGSGNFSKNLEKRFDNVLSIELSTEGAYKNAVIDDFFNYNFSDNKFDLIIGNPPYVKYNEISLETYAKLSRFSDILNKRSNLYLYFILESINLLKDGGELIFIVPKDFINSQSSKVLNKILFDNGTIKYFEDLTDKKIFSDADAEVVIFKYVKGDFDRRMDDGRFFIENNGQLLFLKKIDKKTKFSDFFYVKVGGVSGADKIFTNENGNIDVVYSKTNVNGKTKKMFKDIENDYLLNFKDYLLKRKINKFDDSNWYKWGREFYLSDNPRIYVNMKTRNKQPFFTNECKYYDGSILGIFPKFMNANVDKIAKYLNSLDWDELGFLNGSRFIFKASALENTLLPNDFDLKKFCG